MMGRDRNLKLGDPTSAWGSVSTGHLTLGKSLPLGLASVSQAAKQGIVLEQQLSKVADACILPLEIAI